MTLMDDRPRAGHVGRSLRRKEDPRLITGQATYVDDLADHGMLHAAFVRSPEAHARIVSIDASSALERDEVVAVYTGEDLADLGRALPMAWAPDGVQVNNPEHWPLARGTVKHVGDPVAVVLSQDRYAAWTPRRRSSSSTSRCPWSPTSRPRWTRARRSSTSSSARTAPTTGPWAAATWRPGSPRPT
jgi:xanthine dehydrogenase molybdopterin-binding subunit B